MNRKVNFWPLVLIVLCLASLSLPVSADDAVKEFEKKLEARYKHQKLKVVPPHIIVGLCKDPFAHTNFSVHYDHFHPAVEMPKKYLQRENLDDRTTEEVTGAAQAIDQMGAGETLEVMRIAIFRRTHDFYVVDLMLRALSGKRLATERRSTLSGTEYNQKIPYGVHFRFAFPPTLIDYDAVLHEIDQYLLPVDEYKQVVATAEKAQEGPKNIEIQPGMSKDEVVKTLGEPLKTISFGAKTILKYKDITVEFQDGKVTEVKAN